MTHKGFFRNALGALTVTLTLGIIAETTASADEGMWLPSLISERIGGYAEQGIQTLCGRHLQREPGIAEGCGRAFRTRMYR